MDGLDVDRQLGSSKPACSLLVEQIDGLLGGSWNPGKNVWSCARVSSTAEQCCSKYLMRHPFELIIGLTAWNNGVTVWFVDGYVLDIERNKVII